MEEIEETGVCACGNLADYYGADPYSSEMCWTYQYTPRACGAECGCWDERWMCEDCYTFSVQSI